MTNNVILGIEDDQNIAQRESLRNAGRSFSSPKVTNIAALVEIQGRLKLANPTR